MRSAEGIVLHPTILPGGRWFLSMNGRGEVVAVDMDSSNLEPKLLVKVSQCIEGTEIGDRPGLYCMDGSTHPPFDFQNRFGQT